MCRQIRRALYASPLRSWFLVLKNGPLREVLFGKVEQNGIFSVASHLASVVHPTFKLECFGIGNWLG